MGWGLDWQCMRLRCTLQRLLQVREVMESVVLQSICFLVGVICMQQVSLWLLLWELGCGGFQHPLGGFCCGSYRGKGNVENQREAAIKYLCRLRGPAFVDSAAEQVNEILAELSFVGEDKEVTFGEVFQGKCMKALIIGGCLVLFQQITGQLSVLYYAPSILQTAGFSAAGDATRVSSLLGLLKVFIFSTWS